MKANDKNNTNDAPPTNSKKGGKEKKEKKSQATFCVELAGAAELFHTPGSLDSEGYAAIDVNGHVETWPVNSKGFRRWLSRKYYVHYKGVPGAQAMQDAIGVISGKAIYDGAERQVHHRLAQHGEAIYLDLCDEQWRVVEITPAGWRIINAADCPVRFIRRRGMLPLPDPEPGGSVDELRGLVNVPDDDDWRLVVAWLVAALRPTGPYPALAINGEQGSAKSTLSRYARGLVDPNQSPLRRPPKDERDLMIAANNGWVVAFDNLSGLPASLSDALCCLATGGGFATRELYSDDDEKLFVAQRPALLNGIDEITTRPDLLDRALAITLPTIPDHRRTDEADLNLRFDVARHRILGALLDAVSCALANVDSVTLDRLPRMADFAKWITAAEPALGWEPGTFMRAYTGNREAANDQAIEASAIGPAMLGLMNDREQWSGTSAELLATIEAHHSDQAQQRRRGWPGTAKAMANALRRLAPNLRAIGIAYHPPKPEGKTRRRVLRLERMGNQSPASSAASANAPDGLGAAAGANGRQPQADDPPRDAWPDRPPDNPPNGLLLDLADDADDADGYAPAYSEGVRFYEH